MSDPCNGAGRNSSGAHPICFRKALRDEPRSPRVGLIPGNPNSTPHASTFTSCNYCGEGPEDCPITNSEEIRYSLPCGLTVLDSSCNASAAKRPRVSRWMSTVVIDGLQYSASRVL